MVHELQGEHHLHIRKRIHQKHETYPSPNRWKLFLDKAVYVASFIGLAMTIPQLWKIWIEQNASGVSVSTWMTYLFVNIIWLLYGIEHKEKPIIFTNSILILLELFIVIGTLLYG